MFETGIMRITAVITAVIGAVIYFAGGRNYSACQSAWVRVVNDAACRQADSARSWGLILIAGGVAWFAISFVPRGSRRG